MSNVAQKRARDAHSKCKVTVDTGFCAARDGGNKAPPQGGMANNIIPSEKTWPCLSVCAQLNMCPKLDRHRLEVDSSVGAHITQRTKKSDVKPLPS